MAGDQHVCALTSDGTAYCWGYNGKGQLGDGTNTDRKVPTLVAGSTKFAHLAAGRYFTCGLTSAGATWCWGDNSGGQLGNGSTGAGQTGQQDAPSLCRQHRAPVDRDRAEPRMRTQCRGRGVLLGFLPERPARQRVGRGPDCSLPIGGPPHAQDAGARRDNHTCGLITTDGSAYCWGNNSSVRWVTARSRTPVSANGLAVTGGLKFHDDRAGRAHTAPHRRRLCLLLGQQRARPTRLTAPSTNVGPSEGAAALKFIR